MEESAWYSLRIGGATKRGAVAVVLQSGGRRACSATGAGRQLGRMRNGPGGAWQWDPAGEGYRVEAS